MQIKMLRQENPEYYQRGWKTLMDSLRKTQTDSGILFDDFLEDSFLWSYYEYHEYPHLKEEWVGVIHNPPGVFPPFDSNNNLYNLLGNYKFRSALNKCKMIIVLSDYLKDILESYFRKEGFKVKIKTIRYPCQVVQTSQCFNPDIFLNRIVHAGWWLRNMETFLDADLNFHKILIRNKNQNSLKILNYYQARHIIKNIKAKKAHPAAYIKPPIAYVDHLTDMEYENMFTNSIFFADIIDSSANTLIVECLERNTPIIVNRHPSIEEYLGTDYPLYFHSATDLHKFNKSDVIEAYEYLRVHNKYSYDYFLRTLKNL